MMNTNGTRGTTSFKINDSPFTDINAFIETCSGLPSVKKRKQGETIEYINVPAAFDIETSSFYDDAGLKTSIMYIWQFGINGSVIYGRTWDDFNALLAALQECLNLSPSRRLIVYAHNLSFEFTYLEQRLKWLDVFAMKTHEPLYALCDIGIEFRCSLKLSGYSLDDLSRKLTTYKIQKQTGLLKYDVIRTSETRLTDDELKYAIYDVLVVMAYIREKMDVDGNITRLQLTKTGYVRKYCRDSCLYGGKLSHKKHGGAYCNYRQIMKELTLTPDEYLQMKRAFAGGFTHANALYVDKVVENVDSFDFTSSYPYVMVSERFPMSRGRLLRADQWRGKLGYYLQHYCCIFDVEFKNIRPRIWTENIISFSKCYKVEGKRVLNNGRVVFADLIRTTVTDIDFKAIKRFYEWDSFSIANFRIYMRGYLPKPFIMSILKLYGDKTQLKGVEDRQTDYLNSKEMLNACYGMTVTDIVRDLVTFCETWEIKKPDLTEEIDKYNDSTRRFLFYAWGLFVTSYARYNLYEGIYNFGDDYIYSDTDSIKAKNADKHMSFINEYNERVRGKLEKTAAFYKIPFELFEPATVKGDKKLLGVWEHETAKHKYEMFKTLGAKRYMIKGKNILYDERKDKYYDLSITVSGVNKYTAVPWIIETYGTGRKAFDAFHADEDEGLVIPAEYTGKLTHTYIDEPRSGSVTDYTGHRAEYFELTGVHLEPAEYNMSISAEFAEFCKSIARGEKI